MLSDRDVAAVLAPRLAVYRRMRPSYQTNMLNSLLTLWQGKHARVLDVGGGTGVIGQCIKDLFPVGEVTAVDIVDRFCPELTIETRAFDGVRLPFQDDSFDAATINNVVHHVPVDARTNLFREIRRVVAGPLYIKDHEALGKLDRLRLAVLDFIGNIPFGGMIHADYLDSEDWRTLADGAGYRIAETVHCDYRAGPSALVFPNRLEISMRWERVDG